MRTAVFFLLFFLFAQGVPAQKKPNYDEQKVPEFKLPDPLKTFTGKKIRKTKKWDKIRRPELLSFFTQQVYGEVPGELPVHSADIVEQSSEALNGRAIRKQVELSFLKNNREQHFTILLYLPRGVEKAPLFVGYNFYGNHTVINDVNIIISDAWVSDNPSFGIVHNQLTEQSRGVRSNRWAIDKILDAGFGLATIYYGEIDPDKEEYDDGIQRLFYVDDQYKPADHEWGSIAAWAWGLSRAMDYFELDDNIDASKVVVFGHSRLGKAALWAGANDQRFAGVISNNSGCMGAALSKRQFGETIASINKSFPHWFCDNFKNYNYKALSMPVDQHELLALIAPRPLYVASASEDLWADPRGEFLSAFYASPVYALYEKNGLSDQEMPEVNEPVLNEVAYHIRSGKHDVTDFDWDQYLKWAKKYIQ